MALNAISFLVYIVLTPISTTSGLWSTDNMRKHQQIDVYIYQCVQVSIDHCLFLFDSHNVSDIITPKKAA